MNTSAPSDILRSLDSFEEHFWLMEKVTARAHALIVRITGSASEEQWRAAFDRVQQVHPSLNVSIGKRPGERPFFYRVAERKLPLEFLDLTDSTSLESFAETELLRSFGAGDGPLTRITVFRGEEQSAIVICSHHVVVDGKAHLYILRDALTVLADGELHDSAQSLPASTSQLLGRRTPPYEGRSASNEGDPPQGAVHAIPPIRILRSKVRKTDLDVLLTACRAHSVSFHSALLVALAKMMIRSNVHGHSEGVRALTPVDLRSKLGVEGAVGMFFVLHRIGLPDLLNQIVC
jgi:hypothetical protein